MCDRCPDCDLEYATDMYGRELIIGTPRTLGSSAIHLFGGMITPSMIAWRYDNSGDKIRR